MSRLKAYHINLFYSDEDRGYIVDIPDMSGCSAFGPTPEKALKEVQITRRLGSGRHGRSATPFRSPAIARPFIRLPLKGTVCHPCGRQHRCEEVEDEEKAIDLLRPLVNSLRVGVCGYSGPRAEQTQGNGFV